MEEVNYLSDEVYVAFFLMYWINICDGSHKTRSFYRYGHYASEECATSSYVTGMTYFMNINLLVFPNLYMAFISYKGHLGHSFYFNNLLATFFVLLMTSIVLVDFGIVPILLADSIYRTRYSSLTRYKSFADRLHDQIVNMHRISIIRKYSSWHCSLGVLKDVSY